MSLLKNIKIRFIGDLSIFSKKIQEKVDFIINETSNNTGATINLALNYGGRSDIIFAINKILKSNIDIENLNEIFCVFRTFKECKKINNKVVMARISGYGQNDALESRQAFDATIQAETGFMQVSGHDERPTMIGTVFLDYTTGLNTAVGILAALNFRNQTGKGQLIETSLVSSALSLSMGEVPNYFLNKGKFGKNGNSDRFSSPSNTYKAKDGYLHIMAGSDDRFKGLVNAMDQKELFSNKLYNTPPKRLKNQKKIDMLVNKWTKKNTIKYLGKVLSKNSVPWGKVKTFSQFLNTKTANNNLIKARVNNKNIIVP